MGNLNQVIVDNGGYFTRGEALDCGFVDREIRQWMRTGAVRRIRHGVYVRTDHFDTLDLSGQHAILARAVARNQRGRVAITGPSAVAMHGLALYGQDLQTVDVIRLDTGSARAEAGVRHHVLTDDLEEDLEEIDGIWVVKPGRAVWELATMSSLESSVATADNALYEDVVTAEALRAMGQRFQHRPGSRDARMAVALADGLAESVGESVTRVQCYRFGVPCPDLQFRVWRPDGSLIGRTDFGWEHYRHLAEFDGFVKYQRVFRPGESESDVVIREKLREDELRSGLWGMTRFIWVGVQPTRARGSMAGLKLDLERSRRLYGKGRVIIPL